MAPRMGTKTLGIQNVLLATLLLLSACPSRVQFTAASDEDPLQDFCVAQRPGNTTTTTSINGLPCKPLANVTSSDFKFSGLAAPGNTSASRLGAAVTPAFAAQFPGLNTLGIAVARVDFAPGGLNPPHSHPRATELLFLVQGELDVGFVSSNGNAFFRQTIHAGDLFVFPRGLLHYQKNIGTTAAWAIAALNSQNPGAQQAAAALFRSPLPSDVLQKTFNIDARSVEFLEASV